MPDHPCPACGSEQGYYHDTANNQTRCIACLAPVPTNPKPTKTTTTEGNPPDEPGIEGIRDKQAPKAATKVVQPKHKTVGEGR